jgi:hypothetical protein
MDSTGQWVIQAVVAATSCTFGPSSNQCQYTATGLSMTSEEADWYVRAEDSSGTQIPSAWSTKSFNIPGPDAPSAGFSVSGGDMPVFEWTHVISQTAADEYTVWVLQGNSWVIQGASLDAVTDLACTDDGTCTYSPGVTLASGQTFWYVRAFDTTNGYLSSWSAPQGYMVP